MADILTQAVAEQRLQRGQLLHTLWSLGGHVAYRVIFDRADKFCPKCEKSRAKVTAVEKKNREVHTDALKEVVALRDKLTQRQNMDILDEVR